jgi:hypothetical protein
LADDAEADAILASLLGDALHLASAAGVLPVVEFVRDVLVCLFAYQQYRKLAPLGIPVVELEREATDLGRYRRPDIAGYRAQVDHGDLAFRFSETDEVAQQVFKVQRLGALFRAQQEVIAGVIEHRLKAHQELVEGTE